MTELLTEYLLRVTVELRRIGYAIVVVMGLLTLFSSLLLWMSASQQRAIVANQRIIVENQKIIVTNQRIIVTNQGAVMGLMDPLQTR